MRSLGAGARWWQPRPSARISHSRKGDFPAEIRQIDTDNEANTELVLAATKTILDLWMNLSVHRDSRIIFLMACYACVALPKLPNFDFLRDIPPPAPTIRTAKEESDEEVIDVAGPRDAEPSGEASPEVRAEIRLDILDKHDGRVVGGAPSGYPLARP